MTEERFNLAEEWKKAISKNDIHLKEEIDWVFLMACILGFITGLAFTVLMFLSIAYANN